MSDLALADVWFAIIAFEIGLYLLLDGADLGIGLLSLFRKREHARALMMHAIGPIWDANETWLVIAGGTLFGAFPEAYGVILNGLYIPVMLLIFGLIIRAAAFEFHEYSRSKNFWSVLFGIGSLLAILGQGFMAGGLLSGIRVADGAFAGGPFDWATPLAVLLTAGIALAYLATGGAYLYHRRAPGLASRRALYLLLLAFLGAAFAGVTLLMMPYIVPGALTISQAASSPKTLAFMLWGIGPLLPIVVAYNFYLYRVFRAERNASRSVHYQ